MGNVLVVAFDGLDKELIEKFDLEEVRQQEFGGIDVSTGIENIITSELFACFITGELPEHHGVKHLETWDNPRMGAIVDTVLPPKLVESVRGFHRIKNVVKSAFDLSESRSGREDLELETLFEKIPGSKPMFVPSYNPSIFWKMGAGVSALNNGASIEEAADFWDEKEYSARRKKLMEELESNPKNFLMCHIHRPDFYQHLYGDGKANYDEEKLEQLYTEIDALAAEIRERASGKYDTVIFMSDHGLPDKPGHNERAFYSCNHELFGDETPHITDFHDKILELADSSADLEIEGIEI